MLSRDKMEELYGKYFHRHVQAGKAQGIKLVHSAKCQFYIEGIVLSSFTKKLHQVFDTLKEHLHKILSNN